MYNPKRPRGRMFFFPFVALLFLAALSGIVMLLWNAVVAPVLNVRTLTYGQSIGLLVLCRILFGSFRMGRSQGMRRGGPWRAKWMQMSAEERNKFTEEWKQRCEPGSRKDNAS